jgi:DEAD/DEAH box helicase domain-containing protein
LCLLDDRGAVSVVRVGEETPGAVQAPAPPAEAGTPAGSADAYWHTAWEQAVVYAAPVCHSLLDACRRAGLPAPEVGIDITDARGRVMAMAELAWPDARTAVFLGGQESAVLLAGQAGWQTLLVDGLQESAELGAALIGMLKARDTT